MRKIILISMAAIFAVGIIAQQKMRVWKNHSLVYEEDVTQIDSITFYDEFEGALNGIFSVSPTQKIRFSKGNLQYQASTDTWRFAENQWDFIGEENSNISPTYDGWIDLFGWGTGNNPTIASVNNADYSGFIDWGVNVSSNSVWQTLSADEWEWLLFNRENASSLRARVYVNNIFGILLLPDNWTHSVDIASSISLQDWLIFEDKGAVFLPANGERIGTSIGYVQEGIYYWSSSILIGTEAIDINAYTNEEIQMWSSYFYYGHGVRLVQDVKE